MIVKEPPKLKEDKEKIEAAILFILSLADNLSQYDIAKTLFLADRAHLNKHGRPITFDNYVAMEHGPVPSAAYDALKPSAGDVAFNNQKPWLSVQDAENSKINRYTARREPDLDYLSESDRSALRSALNTVQSLTFPQLRRLTHEDPAYLEAWQRRGNRRSERMKLPLLIEEDGEALATDLIYISSYA